MTRSQTFQTGHAQSHPEIFCPFHRATKIHGFWRYMDRNCFLTSSFECGSRFTDYFPAGLPSKKSWTVTAFGYRKNILWRFHKADNCPHLSNSAGRELGSLAKANIEWIVTVSKKSKRNKLISFATLPFCHVVWPCTASYATFRGKAVAPHFEVVGPKRKWPLESKPPTPSEQCLVKRSRNPSIERRKARAE